MGSGGALHRKQIRDGHRSWPASAPHPCAGTDRRGRRAVYLVPPEPFRGGKKVRAAITLDTPQIGDYVTRTDQAGPAFLHGDLMFRHVFVKEGRLAGIIDWGDAVVTDRHYELEPVPQTSAVVSLAMAVVAATVGWAPFSSGAFPGSMLPLMSRNSSEVAGVAASAAATLIPPTTTPAGCSVP